MSLLSKTYLEVKLLCKIGKHVSLMYSNKNMYSMISPLPEYLDLT